MANEFKVKKGLIVDGSNTVLDIQGTQGQLFSVTDSLTGDLFSVSDVSGVPILNVNSSGAIAIDGYIDGPLEIKQTGDASSDGIRIFGYDDRSGYSGNIYIDGSGNLQIRQTHGTGSGYIQIHAENYLELVASGLIYTTSVFRVYDAGRLDFGSGGDYRIKYNATDDNLTIHTDDSKGITLDNAGKATFTEAAYFTAQGTATYGSINLENDDPFIRLYDNGSGSTTDKKKWDIRAIGATGYEMFDIRTVNDANDTFSTKLSIAHGGNVTFYGTVAPSGSGTKDLGGASNRWATVYTSNISTSTSSTFGGDLVLDDHVDASPNLYFYNQANNYARLQFSTGDDLLFKIGTSTELTLNSTSATFASKIFGGKVHYKSVYQGGNPILGFLIETDVTNGYGMFQGRFVLEQFNYNTKQVIEFSATVTNTGTVHTSKGTADINTTIKIFVYNSKWHIWIPSPTSYVTCTGHVMKSNAYQGHSEAHNSIINITAAAVPSSGVTASTDIVCKFAQGDVIFPGDVEIHNEGNDTVGKLTIAGNNNTGTPGQKTSGTIEHRGADLKTVITHNGSDVITIGTGTDTTFAGDIELAANLHSTGQNLKFHAAGTHVMNIDVNGKVYPNTHNAYDLGHSASLAWRNVYSSGTIYANNINVGGTLSGAGAFVPVSGGTFTGNIRTGTNSFTENPNFDNIVIEGAAHTGMTIFSGTSSDGGIYFGDSSAADGQGQIKYLHGSDSMTFTTNDGAASLTLGSGLEATFGGKVQGVTFSSTINTTQGGFDSSRDYLLAGTGDRGGGVIINDISGARNAIFAGGYDLTFAKETDDGSGTLAHDIWMRANAVNAAGNITSLDIFKNTDITGSLTTTSNIYNTSGQIVPNELSMGDNKKILVGNGDDLQIYHDTSNSYIETSTSSAGDLYVKAQGTNHDLYLQAVDDIFIRPQGGENGIKVIGNGAVELYHDNDIKFQTLTDGFKNYGTFYLENKITHTGDGDTWMSFETDTISFRTGGSDRLVLSNSLATFAGDVKIDGSFKWATTNATSYTYSNADTQGLYIETVGNTAALSDMRFQARAAGTGSYSYIKIKPSNQSILLGTNGADRLTINSSGNATFAGALSVTGQTRVGGVAARSTHGLTAGYSSSTAFVEDSDATDTNRTISIVNEANNSTNSYATLGFRISPSTTTSMGDLKFIRTGADENSLIWCTKHGANFHDRLTIKSDGNVAVKGTDVAVGGTVLDIQGSLGQLFSITNSLTGDLFSVSDVSGVPILNVNSSGAVDVDGTLTATGDVVAYSDERLKTNIETLDGSKVYDMRGVSFNKDNKKSSGVIAQELEKIAPELVNNDSQFKAVAYGNITGYLIEAIKELKSEIEQLKKQIK